MQLHRNQLPTLSRKIVKALTDNGDIDVVSAQEVARDIEAVLNNYLAQVDQVLARARELVQQRGLPQGEFGRIKKLTAEQAGIQVGEDGLDYILNQLLEMLMRSNNVDEVYAEDHVLRRRMRPFVQTDTSADERIDREVRGQLKHVQEGSRMWEIEYARMKADIKRRRGM